MSDKLAKQLRIPLTGGNVNATGVTGHSLDILGYLKTALLIGQTKIQHNFRVCKDLPYTVLLGNDVFTHLGPICFDLKARTLTLRGQTIPLGKHDRDVRTTAAVVIPPHSRMDVRGGMDSPAPEGLYLFEPTLKRARMFVSRSLDHHSDQNVRVSVINAGATEIRLEPGTHLGTCQDYEENLCLPKDKPVPAGVDPGHLVDLDKTDLTPVQKELVRSLINEYRDVIAADLTDLPGTSIVKHSIDTLPGAGPIRSKPYSCPVGLRKEVRKQLDEMLAAKVIEPADGTWCSPIVMVRKSDGSWRFCIDYRRLNDITVKPTFPMTTVDDAVTKLHGKRYFTALDLFSGFWQVELDEQSKDKSTFITEEGCFRFTRMPMGLSGSPFTMQKMAMALNLDMISAGTSMCYVDDYLFMTSTFEQHFGLMKTVLSRMRQAGLRLKLSKCSFFQNSLVYLGHTISRDGLAVESQNVEKMRNFASPTTPRACKRLNGLFSFYRKFIPGFAEIVRPIVRLTKNDVAFEWTEECETAKRRLIMLITTAPILKFPCFTEAFTLTTDASAVAIAGVLSQIQDGADHPISFYSRLLNKAEEKYSAVEQELMAIVMSIRFFAKFLYNSEFRVFTDNISCVYLMKKPNAAPRLARWAVSVQDFSFTVAHKPGKNNVVADALSRPIDVAAIEFDDIPDEEDELPVVELPLDEDRERVRSAQAKDFLLAPLILFLERHELPVDATKGQRRVVTGTISPVQGYRQDSVSTNADGVRARHSSEYAT